MSLLNRLPHRCSILDPVFTQDADDIGNIRTDTARETSVACWVQNASQAEIIEWQRRDQDVTHRVVFNQNYSIEPYEKISITSGPSFVGVTLKVLAITDRSAGLGKLWSALCEEDR